MGEEGEGGGVEGAADLLLSDTCTIPYRNCVTKIPLTLSLAVDFLYMYTYCTVLVRSAYTKQTRKTTVTCTKQTSEAAVTNSIYSTVNRLEKPRPLIQNRQEKSRLLRLIRQEKPPSLILNRQEKPHSLIKW